MGLPEPNSSSPNVAMAVAVTDAEDGPNNRTNNSVMPVFVWAGAILINASFVALITYGSATNWIIGFVFSAFYAAFLLVFGFWLRRRHTNMVNQQTMEEGVIPDESRMFGSNSLLTNIVFLLAVVAIGVFGTYLPLFVISPCATAEYSYSSPNRNCDLDPTSNVPTSVESWWNYESDILMDQSSFAYLPDSDTTIFQGSNQENKIGLWKVSGSGRAPENFPNVSYPHNFFVIGNQSAVCFLAQVETASTNVETLACTDGESLDFFENNENYYLRRQIYSDGLIWLRSNSDVCYDELYSIDPANLTDLSPHMQPPINESSEESGNECSDADFRVLFVGLLFLSALPTVVTSFVLGFRVKVPSMALSGYVSLTYMVFCLVLVVQLSFDDVYDFFRWWLVFTSGPWLLLLTLGDLTKRMTKYALAWGINFSALVYIVAMFFLLQVFSKEHFWRWAVLTVLGIIPLIFVSLATNQPFLMVLAALGLLVEIGRLAFYIADASDMGAGLIVSIVLALSGLLLGCLGFLLSKHYSKIQSTVDVLTDRYLGRWKLSSDNEQSSGGKTSDKSSVEPVDEVKNSTHSDAPNQSA
mmetsp:Transcript_24661/g.24976  ORF Transcript_24661/g.24976 Transcript_24661/m.24976 type:complete len:584 (-) Transcript_24661:1381-3132(-)